MELFKLRVEIIQIASYDSITLTTITARVSLMLFLRQSFLIKLIGFISLLMLSSISVTSADEHFPPPFTARYKLYFKGISAGEGVRTLTYLNSGQFKFSSSAQATGLAALFQGDIQEHTVFERVNGQIRPIEYVYHQGGKKSKDRRILFDWVKGLAKSTDQDQSYELPIEAGVLDSLLYQLVLMQDLKQGKKQLSYQVASKDKVKTYTPTFLGEERIDTGMGQIVTLKYERATDSDERRTTFWCAPTLHYLPVQVEHLEKGHVLRMVLENVQGL